jgi:hypothetical protein
MSEMDLLVKDIAARVKGSFALVKTLASEFGESVDIINTAVELDEGHRIEKVGSHIVVCVGDEHGRNEANQYVREQAEKYDADVVEYD